MKLPLSSLLTKLEQYGIHLSPSEQLKVQEVLQKLGADYLGQAEKLSQILSPVIAKNVEEQEKFKHAFKAYHTELKELAPVATEDWEFPDKEVIKKELNKKRIGLYALAVLFLIGTYAFLLYQQTPSDYVAPLPPSESNEIVNILENASENLNIIKRQEETSSDQLATQSSKEKSDKLVEFDFHPGPRHVIASEAFDFIIESPQDLSQYELRWDFGDNTSSQLLKPKHLYKDPGIYTVRLSIGDESKIMSLPVYDLAVDHIAYNNQQLQEQVDKLTMIKWSVFLLALVLIIGVESYLESLKHNQYSFHFKQFFQSGSEAPYSLPYPDWEEELQAEAGMYSLAEKLKKRRASENLQLDIKHTLYETVRSGGFPALVYEAEKESCEYLVLIDESGPSDHLAELFEQLMLLLKKEEVPIVSFRFRNDPRFCYNEDFPEGIELDLIDKKIRADRLLIFSKASYLIDLKTHQLADWAESSFEAWSEKVILTPEPINSWGFRERELQGQFKVLEANLSQQEGILEALLADDIQDFESMKSEALASSNAKPPLEDYDFESKEDLQDYLGDALYKWVTASMLSAEPSWAMTLKIGKALDKASGLETDANKLVSYDKLLKLSRIPWMQSGEAPLQLKKDLLKELDPQTEELARQAILELLEETEVPPGSQAYQQKQIQKSIHEAALYPEDQKLQEKLRFLWSHNMLNSSMQSLMKRNSSWSISDYLSKYNRFISPALLSLILGAFLAFSAVQSKKYSDQHLFDKYFDSFHGPTEVFGISKQDLNSLHEADRFRFAMAAFSNGDYEDASEVLENSQLDGFASELKDWYLSLAYLAKGESEISQSHLQRIKSDPNNRYYFQAKSLSRDLNNFWRF
ncbi:MAG: PKD domain-containing protein [Bacteroidia bacterium]|nr:PKD domain-containing protein [Bacteroidia bacterium]